MRFEAVYDQALFILWAAIKVKPPLPISIATLDAVLFDEIHHRSMLSWFKLPSILRDVIPPDRRPGPVYLVRQRGRRLGILELQDTRRLIVDLRVVCGAS